MFSVCLFHRLSLVWIEFPLLSRVVNWNRWWVLSAEERLGNSAWTSETGVSSPMKTISCSSCITVTLEPRSGHSFLMHKKTKARSLKLLGKYGWRHAWDCIPESTSIRDVVAGYGWLVLNISKMFNTNYPSIDSIKIAIRVKSRFYRKRGGLNLQEAIPTRKSFVPLTFPPSMQWQVTRESLWGSKENPTCRHRVSKEDVHKH